MYYVALLFIFMLFIISGIYPPPPQKKKSGIAQRWTKSLSKKTQNWAKKDFMGYHIKQ